MAGQSSIYTLRGVVQHYAWGGAAFLPSLLDLPNAAQEPFAEYWMGAHPNAPSRLFVDGQWVPMDDLISRQGASVLGQRVFQEFGRLPYLFKVLDVKDMLSIQVHPSKKAAEKGFREEASKGIPLNAANRNFRDDNHKPELMLALSEFWLLHGFQPAPAITDVLHRVPELGFLIPEWEKNAYEGVYRKVMLMPQLEVQERLMPLVKRLLPAYEQGRLDKSGADFWVCRAYSTFCSGGMIDRGLFSIYLLNLLHLQPGDAIYQDAGILHAYLEGQNLELMANSDNVLRGGLTHKYIDVGELLRHVRFEPVIPGLIHPIRQRRNEWGRYPTPALDFELQILEMAGGDQLSFTCATAEIFIVLEGSVEASHATQTLILHNGQSFLGTSGAAVKLVCQSAARVFRATVP